MNLSQDIKQEFLRLKSEISLHIDRIDTSKNSHLQNYLYFIHYPLFNFTESIIILCESGKFHSAKILLRSLFEAHINIIYHQIDESEHRLALSAKAGFDTKIKIISEIKDLVRRYPNLESPDPKRLFSKKWLQDAGEWAEVQRKAILKGNNLVQNDQDPDLKSKAIKCDKASIKNVEPGHFERMYTVIYRQLSPASHLDIEGLEVFVNQKETGKYMFGDGNGGDFIIGQAIEICLAFTKDLYESGLIKSKITDTVQRLDKLIKQADSEIE